MNFEYLNDCDGVTGVDIQPKLLEKVSDLNHGENISTELIMMDAQSLAFGDDTFDTVISSFSTCTFHDPIEALNEMARVCKPDGNTILLEHGKTGGNDGFVSELLLYFLFAFKPRVNDVVPVRDIL